MNSITIQPAASVRGEITVPGDKSISHRSIMLGAIANGVTTVRGFLRGEDNLSTMHAFRAMGVNINDDGETIRITGRGLHGLHPFRGFLVEFKAQGCLRESHLVVEAARFQFQHPAQNRRIRLRRLRPVWRPQDKVCALQD